MKVSKFLKDLIITGLSQVVVLLFGFLLIKIMTASLDSDYFGLFTLMRKWISILLPVMTLNLTLGLTRYISFEEENARFYLNIALLVFGFLSTLMLMVFLLFPGAFAELLFNDPGTRALVYILVFFLAANFMELITYSYFRGKLNMSTANGMRTLFYGVPLLLGLGMLVKKSALQAAALNLFFLLYSAAGVFIGIYYLRKEFSFTAFRELFKIHWRTTFDKSRNFFFFGLNRIPAVVFNALVLSLPAVIAAHRISLTAAGYMGLVLMVLRLLEVFSMPFNMIFLPKFSAMIKDNQMDNIKNYSLVVLDFIFTFLPVVAVMLFGLTHYIVVAWVGPTYIPVVKSIAVTILFSMFYLAYALIRGILDGLFTFPYCNFINFAGFFVMAVLSLLMGYDVFRLTLAFGCGLLALGLFSIGVLAGKLNLAIPWKTILTAITGSVLLFLFLGLVDGHIKGLHLKGLAGAAVCVSYRALPVLGIWWFYWRKMLWHREVLKRIRFKPGENGVDR